MFDQNLWNSTQAEGFSDKEAPIGQHVVTVAEGKFALTGEAKNKPTIIVEYRTANGDQWADVKQLTSEGRVKSAKILLRDLGLDPEALTSQEQIHAGLKSLEGKYFNVEVKESSALNSATGKFYRNTDILGPYLTPAGNNPSPTPEPVPVAAGATSDEDIPF